jgi:aminoglycoside phosphotransferase (APT) family kinase protein
LTTKDAVVRERAASLSDVVDDVAVVDRWAALSATPPWDRPPVWLHGDLHPGNVLVSDGRISAVIDFGDITAGDPATDLAVAWMLLPATARPTLRRAAGDVDDHTWARAQGWALMFGLMFAASSAGNSAYTAFGLSVVEDVLADTVPGT